MIQLNYASLLTSQNVQAFYRVVREGESSQDDHAYHMRYGGWNPDTRRYNPVAYFDDFSAHPRVMELTPTGEYSSAAGAPQITWTTWSTVCMAKYGLGPSFGPYDQDCAYVALLHHRGALDDVIDGRFDDALHKCRAEWASLPGSTLNDGGGKLAYDRARAVYSAWGGTFYDGDAYVIRPETQEPAPIEERSTPATQEDVERINQQEGSTVGALAFIMPLLQGLFSVFEPLVKAKVSGALDKQIKDPVMSNQVASEFLNIIKQAAGIVTTTPSTPVDPAMQQAEQIAEAVEAIKIVKADPTLIQQVQNDMLAYLDRIAPMIDRIDQMERSSFQDSEDSRDRAANRAASGNDDWMAKSLVIGILVVSLLLILFVGGVAITQIAMLDTRTPTTEVWAAITGIIGTILGILGTVFAYRFGTSRSSSAKDVVISEMSNARRIRNG